MKDWDTRADEPEDRAVQIEFYALLVAYLIGLGSLLVTAFL